MTPVRLEPAASQSWVKHSTTEPLRSLGGVFATCYWLSKYHCIENNGTSSSDVQVEPKMSRKLCNTTLIIGMILDVFNFWKFQIEHVLSKSKQNHLAFLNIEWFFIKINKKNIGFVLTLTVEHLAEGLSAVLKCKWNALNCILGKLSAWTTILKVAFSIFYLIWVFLVI